MGPGHGLAALPVDLGAHGIPHLEHALGDLAVVHIFAALVLLYVGDLEANLIGEDHAVVGHLAAHLGVEGGLVQYHNALHAGHQFLGQLVFHHQGHYFHAGDRLDHVGAVIADELRLGHVLAKLHPGPSQVAQGLPGLAGPPALLLHELLELRLVQIHPLLLHHLQGQVNGETVGVVQLKGVRAGEGLVPLLLVAREHLVENFDAAVDGLGEVLLLHPDHLGDIVLPLPQLGVVALVLVDDGAAHQVEEGLVDPQQLAVAGGPAQQAAQHIAPALVGGQHAVADHKHGGADMVGNHPEGHVLLPALAVVGLGDLGHLVGDVHHRVHIEQGSHPLAHAGQPLQPHAGVDVLLLQLGVVVVPVVVELGKHHVPNLDIAVALTAHGAPGPAAAVLLAAVIVDFGAGAAGAGAVLPEVILLAELEDALGGDADLLVPDAERLVVGGGGLIAGKHGGVQAAGVQPHPLRGGQKLPGPVDGLLFKVVAKGEIAQHLKIGAVAVGMADVLNVAGADALLAGGYPVARGLLLPGEKGLHGGHARVNKEQGRVVLGDQGEAGQAQVAFGLKELQEHLPQLVQAVGLGIVHGNYLRFCIFINQFSLYGYKLCPCRGIGGQTVRHTGNRSPAPPVQQREGQEACRSPGTGRPR